MNLKLVIITSLLVGTTFASNTASPVATLAEEIEKAYSTARADPKVWEERMATAKDFDYKKMDEVKGAQPFCSLNPVKLGDELTVEELGIYNGYVEALRDPKNENYLNAVDFKNLQLANKINHILNSTGEFIGKLESSLTAQELPQYLRDEILAFKIALSSYEAKTKNFKEIRAVMEALHGIFRFNLKADEFIRVIVEALKDENISEKAALLNRGLFELAGVKSEDSTEDVLDALKKAKLKENDNDTEEVKKMKKLINHPLIIKALHKAHDKTSSPLYLGAYASSMIIVAFAILFWKHSILVKKESQEFDD